MRVRIVLFENVRDDEPVYVISKAAELAGMHPQTLRQYDRLGLVSPRRTQGRGRRYSKRNVMQLVEIQRLSHEEGINLAGIKRIMDLENQVRALEARVELLAAQANPGSRVFMAGAEGDVVSQRRKPLFGRRPHDGDSSRGPADMQSTGRRGFRSRPLQLTARVEEIDRTQFAAEHGGTATTESHRIVEISRSQEPLGAGRAVIVWTPDE